MRFYPLNIIIICGLLNPARTLRIFNGTLTEITCSAAIPIFHVMEQGVVYAYDQLPDLFDIEARFFSAGNNVTLYINGTDRSNNVTVTCGYTDLFSARFQVLFTLTLEFVSILPTPNNVHYNIIEDPAGYLQISWEPPTLVSDELSGAQNVSVDSRITHFIIYITNESTTIVYNASRTSLAIGTDEISCTFSYQVAAVNPAGVGERSPPQNFDWCMDSSSSTTVMIIDHEPIAVSSGLSAGEIAAVIVGVVLIIIGLLVMLAIVFAKLKNDRHQHVIRCLKSELRSDQLSNPTEDSNFYYRRDQLLDPDLKDSVAEIEKCVESDHCGSTNGNDPNIMDKKQQSDSTLTRSYSQDGPPLYYAEIDVLTKKQNKIPEPSSTEETSHHVYAILEQPSPQIGDTDQEKFNDDDDNPDLQD